MKEWSRKKRPSGRNWRVKEGRDKRRREGSDGRVVAEEKEEAREGDAWVGVFRRKPGSTKRLCCCPARPAVPSGNENPPLPSTHEPHQTTVFSSTVHFIHSSNLTHF